MCIRDRNWGINFDIRLIGHQGPDPTSRDLDPMTVTTKFSSDDFEESFFLKTTLSLGLVILL